MNRATVLNRLQAHKAALAQRFGVVDLALFGSFARDQATDASDVDILVQFDGPADWRRHFGAQAYLEHLLDRPVDMATRTEIREEIRPYVERDIVHV
ncbi:MAG: nucleotidyltransferase family protein [Cyanobacteria bacterium MAG CAR3_bin_5]|nr:nucleotidyltransferase family protein [Cyanobacteria bacterium MAG CAR4_bin_6]MCY4173716.1 nucleotidyltransferase family protein [Cyanobacteria bacterium MAG CAR3_bin_5]MCY4332883.1 nucleotidyltransferase family protein [Cyanobacteria bacterium MAG CAR1_bin_15]